jgi:hypothetical protein
MKKFILACILLSLTGAVALAQTITVTSPNGGEDWALGSSHAITWSSSGVTGNVRILLFKGGANIGIIKNDVPATAGSIDWVVGTYQGGTAVPGTDYKVRIKKMQTDIMDASNREFVISAAVVVPPPAGSITVLSPNGGETYSTGPLQTSVGVRWASSGVTGDVRLILKKGTETVKTVVVPSSGSSEMSLSGVVAGNDYRIRIESLNGAVFDESDRTFTISAGLTAIEIRAEVRMPPMILSFAIDGGAESTTASTATLNHTARNGATHYRWKDGLEENWQDWATWNSAPTVRLPPLFGLRKIFLQLKNNYGESRVADDLITVIDTREQEYEVDAGMIAGPCPGNWPEIHPDWKEISIVDRTPPDAGKIEICELTSPGKYGTFSLVVDLPIPVGPLALVGGEKCEFVMFSGRLLNEGWSFVRLIYDPPSPENFRIAQQPSPGGRDITFRIRMWSGGGYSPHCKMKKVVIRGPFGRDPVEAFR